MSSGIFISINGRETKIVDQNLYPGDIIGVKIDSQKGRVSFDINNHPIGERLQLDALLKNNFYPTADIGMARDQVIIIEPPTGLKQFQ